MAIGTIASIAAIASAAASLSAMGYQAAQGAPGMPNLANASRQTAEATANALPIQRALAAAAQQGGTAQVPTAAHTEKVERPYVEVPARNGGGGTRMVPYVESQWQPGGLYYKPGGQLPDITMRVDKVKRPAGTKTVDFGGYGTADIEGELARQFTDMQLELSKKYGTQFAEEARKNLEQADPQGTAARKMEYQMIQDQLNNPKPINPLSTGLESQIDSQLKAGSGLDPMSRDLLDAAVAKASAARAGTTDAGDVAGSMSTGYEGAARRQAGIDKAQSFLSSGATPEDIAYRREQQNLANLGAFVGGRTPESQFQSLSGTSRGAAPFYPGQPLPNLPANAGASGANAAVAGYQANVQQQAGQMNPWMTGLSSVLQGVGAYANAVKPQ